MKYHKIFHWTFHNNYETDQQQSNIRVKFLYIHYKLTYVDISLFIQYVGIENFCPYFSYSIQKILLFLKLRSNKKKFSLFYIFLCRRKHRM